MVRIAQFATAKDPESDATWELLCEDHNGTYLLPFPCRRVDSEWRNQATGQIIVAEIVGWRAWTNA